MYQVGVVQNESEMMRYSWADLRPTLEHFGYEIRGFTGENVAELVAHLDDYDAVILATNSCNSARILDILRREGRTPFRNWLLKGRGLFIGYQAKLGESDSYGFLPEDLEIRACNRSRDKERTIDGNLVSNDLATAHPIMTFPNAIEISAIETQCRHNNLVEGLYWAYLEPIKDELYDQILIDAKYPQSRPIMICSRSDLPGRVVAASLVVDWQGHNALWENVIKYVTEGRPSIAIVSRRGQRVRSFSYLVSTARQKKLPVAGYDVENIEEVQNFPIGPHDILIIDPAWDAQEILDLHNSRSLMRSGGFNRVFFFENTRAGDVVVNSLSHFKDFGRIAQNGLTWLTSAFPSEGRPYWAGSFWTTIDVLKTLRTFGHPIDQYESRIGVELRKHDIDGSYDEVLGPTCGLLQVYSWFYGKSDERFKRTLRWILDHLEGKTLYERAGAVCVLCDLNVGLDSDRIQAYRNEFTMADTDAGNEFAVERYIRVLLDLGFSKDAERQAVRLKDLQDVRTGKWINTTNTSATVLTLLDLQEALPQKAELIEEMLFRAVQYIKNGYKEDLFSWNEDHLSTALALRALKRFESTFTFPVDELLVSLSAVREEAPRRIAIDEATQLNAHLQRTVNRLRSDLLSERKSGLFAKYVAVPSVGLCLAFVSFIIIFLFFVYEKGRLSEAAILAADAVVATRRTILPILAIVTTTIFLGLLRKFALMPKWLARFVMFWKSNKV